MPERFDKKHSFSCTDQEIVVFMVLRFTQLSIAPLWHAAIVAPSFSSCEAFTKLCFESTVYEMVHLLYQYVRKYEHRSSRVGLEPSSEEARVTNKTNCVA